MKRKASRDDVLLVVAQTLSALSDARPLNPANMKRMAMLSEPASRIQHDLSIMLRWYVGGDVTLEETLEDARKYLARAEALRDHARREAP